MDTPTTSVHSPAYIAGHAEVSLALSLDLNRLPDFDTQLDALLPQLTQFNDDQLIRLAAHARRLESCAFRLRGACAAELRRRIKTRLTGGRGRRDASGVGTGAHLARLAERIGVSISTLKTDARIHEVFFTNREETRLAREPSLAREFYVTALAAPEPLAAIRLAAEKCAVSNYKRDDFRRDIIALKRPSTPPIERSAEVRIRVVADACVALAEMVAHSGQTPEAIVAAALLSYHKLQTTPSTQTPKIQRRAMTTVSRQMQPSLLPPSMLGRSDDNSGQADL